jgi:type III restriction enzyme
VKSLKTTLKEFQERAVEQLVRHLRMASREVGSSTQAVILSSPTGSGKTMMATAAIERILEGDGEYAPDNEAVVLWLSDQPEINEQTRRKMQETSSVLGVSRLVVLDVSFDVESFPIGSVYFLNIQKLGKEKQLVVHSDSRSFTIWETISNTVRIRPAHFFVFIDEAHRGMTASARDVTEAATIVQKFIKGSEGEIPAVPIVVGISATPQRFERFLEETPRTIRRVIIRPDQVRDSGLIKETIRMFYPTVNQPTDITMLRAACKFWRKNSEHWARYCQSQNEEIVRPILVVQVQDGTGGRISNTDMAQAIDSINDEVGPIDTVAFAHSFQEGTEVTVASHNLRYLAPPDISADPEVKVVFFKTSLNTGWDCPRAEVMMSFRKAIDATLIAQLVGRMVRTPLARRIDGDEFLNSVGLYLPHYDEEGLTAVVQQLTRPDPEILPPVDIERGEDFLTLARAPGSEPAFDALEQLPSYVIPRLRKIAGARRLMKLSRLLSGDEIRPEAVEEAREKLLSVLKVEYNKIKKTALFKATVHSKGKVKVRAVDWQLSGQLMGDETIELDIARENVDDLFDAAGRKLGEGLHKAWWRLRLEKDEELKTEAKLEAVAFSIIPSIIAAIERKAQGTVRDWLDRYRQEINGLPESRQELYNEIRRLAAEPEEIRITYPTSIEIRKDDKLFAKHLYVDEKGLFPSGLNRWENSILQSELGKSENARIMWLRNFDRKSWSLTVPYESGGEFRALYPDFLFVRSTRDGCAVDLLDPHQIDLADAPAKAAGLARYAAKHAHMFGRIELIIMEGEKIRRLNLRDEVVRDKVRAVSTTEHLRQLYEDVGEDRLSSA